MKDLKDFVTESESKELRFSLNGIENGEDTANSIVSLAQKNGSYAEKTSDGVKVKGRGKLDSILDVLQQLVQNAQSDKKYEEDSEYKAKVDKLGGQVNKLSDFIDSANEPEEPKEEPKKDDDEE